jgi:hypothetical protein
LGTAVSAPPPVESYSAVVPAERSTALPTERGTALPTERSTALPTERGTTALAGLAGVRCLRLSFRRGPQPGHPRSALT